MRCLYSLNVVKEYHVDYTQFVSKFFSNSKVPKNKTKPNQILLSPLSLSLERSKVCVACSGDQKTSIPTLSWHVIPPTPFLLQRHRYILATHKTILITDLPLYLASHPPFPTSITAHLMINVSRPRFPPSSRTPPRTQSLNIFTKTVFRDSDLFIGNRRCRTELV